MNWDLQQLEDAGVLIAVRGDEELVRIVATDLDAHEAVMDGFTLHSPVDLPHVLGWLM